MRAITVRQPWAWQIIHQLKSPENRTRNIAGSYRGPVAIHAGLAYDEDAMYRLPARPPEWVTSLRVFNPGVILGVVDLTDVHKPSTDFGSLLPCCPMEWGQPEAGAHLVVENPRPLLNEIPCKGKLGLWTPPDDVVREIERQLAYAGAPVPHPAATDPSDGGGGRG